VSKNIILVSFVCLFVCFFVAMFITVATLRENGCSYYYETFKIKGQSIYDYAITFAMRQHGSTLQ